MPQYDLAEASAAQAQAVAADLDSEQALMRQDMARARREATEAAQRSEEVRLWVGVEHPLAHNRSQVSYNGLLVSEPLKGLP